MKKTIESALPRHFSAVEKQSEIETQLKMKNALALIEQFRPKNAKEVLRKNDEKLRMQLEQ